LEVLTKQLTTMEDKVVKTNLEELEMENTYSKGETFFGNIQLAPPDSILGVNAAFKKDTNSQKVNLSIGAYRTEEGQPFVLRAVKLAEDSIVSQNLNKEYIPQDGIPEFCVETRKFLLGENSLAVKENRVCTLQSLSGTGALRIGFEFVKRFLPGRKVLVSFPTWGNHFQILEHCDIPYEKYPYFDKKTKGLDFNGMMRSIESVVDGSIVLLHSCAHNPTGVDPSPEQWKKIAEVCRRKNHIVFFDSAYQGFASGDLVRDAYSIRLFESMGFEFFCAQSFAKNFGLYGERVGAIHVVCNSTKAASNVLSQMHIIVRTLYSSPPLHGARIVTRVLTDPKLFALWEEDLKKMANRIIAMREELLNRLVKLNTPGDWTHIVKQIGMFSFLGLTPKQCESLVKDHHVYLLANSRISMAGLNMKNADYVAKAIHTVVTTIRE